MRRDLSTTTRVLRVFMREGFNLSHRGMAERLHMGSSTLMRKLRTEGTTYQKLLDRARLHRLRKLTRDEFRPAKCYVDDLGFNSVNSLTIFIRRQTGMTYAEYRERGGYQP